MSICNSIQLLFQQTECYLALVLTFNFSNNSGLRFQADGNLFPHLRQALLVGCNMTMAKKSNSTKDKTLPKFEDLDPLLQKMIILQCAEAKYGDDKPSLVTSKPWVYATNDKINYPSSKNSGKWCVFVNKSEHDEWWIKIRQCLYEGKLGDEIKTGTRLGDGIYKNKAVIIVYTYDYNDENDVMRIREELRKIGLTWKIAYKTDKATLQGKYAKTSKGKVSLHFI
jgi:hypothetical protein